MRASDKTLVRGAAQKLYGNGQKIWDPQDDWNSYKRSAIDAFAERLAQPLICGAEVILDAGCGSETYNWMPDRTISLDRFPKQVQHKLRPVVGDLERLPFGDESVDFVICVASVLNYTSAAEAISEMARVLRPRGHLLLHFETSTSFEQLLRSRWGNPAICVNTINSGRPDTLWIYRPSYIATLLERSGLVVRHKQSFHIASALGLRLGFSQRWSAKLACLDGFLGTLQLFGDDLVILAEKHA